jgi:hypothetical protein
VLGQELWSRDEQGAGEAVLPAVTRASIERRIAGEIEA